MEYKIKDIYSPLNLEDFALKGKIAKLNDIFFYERAQSDYAKEVIYKETEEAFEAKRDDLTPVCYWQGEFWGKWVISAARICRYKGDESLKEFLKNAAHNLLRLQREDGYIGTYNDSKNFFAANPEVTKGIIGWSCDWNWNIWCRKYTLWGLLEIYSLVGDEEILAGAARHADQLIGELRETGAHILDTGTFCGLPSGSIMKPMLILYKLTEDKKYLDFCLDIAARWETPQIAGLIYNSLNKTRISDWYENFVTWSKTYESLSCFDGIIELYRVTGDKKYLESAENFYELLEETEKNILFSVGYNDQYHNAADEINSMTEPCDVIHYIRLCTELYRLTGKAKYMDSVELAYYNSLLASANKDGKWGSRAVCSAGMHTFATGQANMKYSHCCVNNMPRGLLNAAESAVFNDGKELTLCLYHPFTATAKVGETVAKIEVSGDYLGEQRADISVTFHGNPVPVRLRIPVWSKKTGITVNGREYNAESGYFAIKETGNLKITAQFDNTLYINEWEKSVVRHEARDWEYARLSGPSQYERIIGRILIDKPRCLLRKGAVLLCRSKLIGNTGEEMFDPVFTVDKNTKCIIEKTKAADDMLLTYKVTFNKNGEIFETKVCDYASAGNVMNEEKELFCVYF